MRQKCILFKCWCKPCFCSFLKLFLAVLGLPCCEHAFSSCSKQGLLSLQSSGSRAHRLQYTGLVARGIWNPPESGIKPTSWALAAGFLTTGPPGKSSCFCSFWKWMNIRIAQGTLFNLLWWLDWEGSPKGRHCMCLYGWFILLHSRN